MEALPQRILIIKPSSLGDVIHALPALAALRRIWPAAHVAWLVGTSFAPVLQGHPQIDELIPFDRRRYGALWRSPRALRSFWKFVAELRRRRFDLVIDLQGLLRSGLMAYFSGARRRVGFADARELSWVFYTERVACPRGPLHAIDKNLRLVQALAAATHERPAAAPTDEPDAGDSLSRVIGDEERRRGRELLAAAGIGESEPFVGVFVGARWASKLWPVAHFAELLERLHQAGAPRAVLLGAPEDQARAEGVRAVVRCPVSSLVGRSSLRELLAIVERAALIVSLDSGPLHVAAALRRPTVAVFGPTDPRRTGPHAPSATTLTCGAPCAPCLRRVCPLRHHDCMQKLSAQLVAEAALEKLR